MDPAMVTETIYIPALLYYYSKSTSCRPNNYSTVCLPYPPLIATARQRLVVGEPVKLRSLFTFPWHAVMLWGGGLALVTRPN